MANGDPRYALDIAGIVGARPNFMKMAAIAEAAQRRPGIRLRIIHTGQHYSPEMSKLFFDDLGLPEPSVNLEVDTGSEIAQISDILRKLEPVLVASRPDIVLVVGDVNSTVAASIAAAKLRLPLAHVEAGLKKLRSVDAGRIESSRHGCAIGLPVRERAERGR